MDNSKNDLLKVIQLSDSHLFADDTKLLFGVNTNEQFSQLITQLQATELHDTDLIFLTGDLSQDETPQSYDFIVKTLDSLNIPIYWIPGNHDNPAHMTAAFKKGKNFFNSRRLTTQYWDFIFLNTKKDNIAEGFLSEDELSSLQLELRKPSQKPTAVVMHHHPTQVATPLIDQYILQNHSAFWDIVKETQVKLVMCGHVHQDHKMKSHEVSIETAPATCFQFPPHSTTLTIDAARGCKIYYFTADQFTATSKWG